MTDKRNLNQPSGPLLGACKAQGKCTCQLCAKIWLEHMKSKYRFNEVEGLMPVTNAVLMVKVAEVSADLAQLEKVLAQLAIHVNSLQTSVVRKASEES